MNKNGHNGLMKISFFALGVVVGGFAALLLGEYEKDAQTALVTWFGLSFITLAIVAHIFIYLRVIIKNKFPTWY